MGRKPAGKPEGIGENGTGKRQMDGKPVLADIDPVDEAGLDHPPADETLKTAQCEKKEQSRLQPVLDAPGEPENGKGNGKDEADHAAEETMPPFPPENGLERLYAHACVLKLVFGNLLVFFEFFLPLAGGKRRDYAVDRLPFGDRQTGIRQPRGAAYHNHRQDHRADEIKPPAQQRAVFLFPCDGRLDRICVFRQHSVFTFHQATRLFSLPEPSRRK